MRRLLQNFASVMASLRLTVVLFAMAMFLIFAGTLAQRFQGNWAVVNEYFRSFWVLIPTGVFVPLHMGRPPGVVPFPGGFLIGGVFLVNLVAAHAVRFKYTRTHLGIMILHLGVILLLVSEFVTALFAVESTMSIDEGGSARYAVDLREVELAIIDPSPPDQDAVVAVPQALLRNHAGKSPIQDDRLPFEVTVETWMDNSRIVAIGGPDDELHRTNPANAGLGMSFVALPLPAVTGVEEQVVDVPSAYVTLRRRGAEIGTVLVSAHIQEGQPVSVGNKSWGISLRFKRQYKNYTMHLIDFRHDTFIGTDIPRNFSSKIRLVDPTRKEDRQVLIYMNHPLRYRGETFYQAAYKPDGSGTILQVVRNPGWLLPYIACVLVGLGMSVHFVASLAKSAGRARP